jgi:hypothetical protein
MTDSRVIQFGKHLGNIEDAIENKPQMIIRAERKADGKRVSEERQAKAVYIALSEEHKAFLDATPLSIEGVEFSKVSEYMGAIDEQTDSDLS